MDNPRVVITKLVYGGQGMGELADGRKVFVWNALPGEEVEIRIIKKRRDYAEAIAERIIMPSSERIEPEETNYLSTSPWQMMTYLAENTHKKEIVRETFAREHVPIPDFELVAPSQQWRYRNKMEYSFWGDDDGLHLALHQRGSHGKQIVQGSHLALKSIDEAAAKILVELQKLELRAGQLKTLIVRCDQAGKTVVSLFVKDKTFPRLSLPEGIQGIRVFHSNPKSPASVPTALIYEQGSAELTDTLLTQSLTYDVNSFFQVNIPIFRKTLERIQSFVDTTRPVVDMYGGVGSIGLSLASQKVTIVELDPATAAMARKNAKASSALVVQTSTEKALEYIKRDETLIVDPPRSGLHKDVVATILKVQPERVIYLSCNPVTQARDLGMLQGKYRVAFVEAYNFFPRTPHIESLAVLERE